jgi:hypothetical protein
MRCTIVIAVCLACSSSTPNQAKNGSGTAAEPAKPEDAMKQAIYPADALLAWLDKLPTRTMVRMPVLVQIADNRTYVESARVGDAPDGLEIDANDSQMGVPIAGKWGFFCKQEGNTCLLMLSGEWVGGERKEFQVREIEKAIADAERTAATFAEVIQ